jgi:hypothetical protein
MQQDKMYEKASRSRGWMMSLSYRMSGGIMGLFGVAANPGKVIRAKNRIARGLVAPPPSAAP